MASWIWAIDANAGWAGWEKQKKAAYLSLSFNTLANVLPVYTMATVLVTSVPNMVNQVIAASSGDKISRLILMGHGASGVQCVGCGEYVNLGSTTPDFLAIDPSTGSLMNNVAPQLNGLVPYLAAGARVSLAGCDVAALPDGPALLEQISLALFGTTVEGGKWIQDAAIPGYFGPVLRCTNGFCSTIYGPYKEFR